MLISLRQRIASIMENIYVLVNRIAMKRFNCSKCLDVEENEFLTWDAHNERKVFFFFLEEL